MELQRTRLGHFGIDVGRYQDFTEAIISLAERGSSAYVCVANVHMFVEAWQNDTFREVVNGADIVTPDGQPLTWGLRCLKGIRQPRVAGSDIVPDLLEMLERKRLPVFFYGGSQELLERTSSALSSKFPSLKVAGMKSPPFRNLQESEIEADIDEINQSGARLLFVVLGCPKQERWMAQMRGRVNCVMVGIGGALPIVAGLQRRAPRWMQKVGIEWLFRLFQEPKRLFRRYAVTNSVYFYIIIKEVIRQRLASRRVKKVGAVPR